MEKKCRVEVDCKSCHWWSEEVAGVGCVNIGVDGWEHWCDEQKAPIECNDYCKKGEYVPTGIWAQVANVVKEVEKMVERENNG